MSDSMTLHTGTDVDRAVAQFSSCVSEFTQVATNLAMELAGLTAALNAHTEALDRVSYLETQARYGVGSHPGVADLMNTLTLSRADPEQFVMDMMKMLSTPKRGK